LPARSTIDALDIRVDLDDIHLDEASAVDDPDDFLPPIYQASSETARPEGSRLSNRRATQEA
jgi:hypothetical protein